MFALTSSTTRRSFLGARNARSTSRCASIASRKPNRRPMGKRKLPPVPEDLLSLSTLTPPSSLPIVDTHAHILSTFQAYQAKYPEGKHRTIAEFIRAFYVGQERKDGAVGVEEGGVERNGWTAATERVVDVWCEAPVLWKEWEEILQSVEGWRGIDYHFVMGVHPHEARNYNDATEALIEKAASHRRNVGIGEIGLDYHYDNSPREIQQEVFRRQLRLARRLDKPVTIHTREADDDCWRVLTEELPAEWKLHIHCFTDSLGFAVKLLQHFPNLRIGITGVVTFSSNENTRSVIEWMVTTYPDKPLRILLETDSPYMIPSTLPVSTLGLKSGQKLPFSHSGMIPWTAEHVAQVARTAGGEWDADRVMKDARQGAREVYGV